MPLTIRIPIPQTNPPFMHRSKGLSAYLAPSQQPATRGIGAFFASRAAPVLPAPSIFSRFARRASGLGSFVAPASYALPGPSLFPQFARRGLGAVARTRRFPRSGMGEMMPMDYMSQYNPSYYYDNYYDDFNAQGGSFPLPAWMTDSSASLSPVPDYYASGANMGSPASTPSQATTSGPTVSDLVAQGYSQTQAENIVISRVLGSGTSAANLDAFNTALSQAQAKGTTLTAAQLSAVNNAAAQATPAQLATLTQQVSALSPTGTDAFSTLWASIQKWFNGSTTLFGSAWKNSTLVIGGGATIAGLALLSSMTGGKKTTRRRNPKRPERCQAKHITWGPGNTGQCLNCGGTGPSCYQVKHRPLKRVKSAPRGK